MRSRRLKTHWKLEIDRKAPMTHRIACGREPKAVSARAYWLAYRVTCETCKRVMLAKKQDIVAGIYNMPGTP